MNSRFRDAKKFYEFFAHKKLSFLLCSFTFTGFAKDFVFARRNRDSLRFCKKFNAKDVIRTRAPTKGLAF